MGSEYKVHRPYVLATLPRPLDHTDGRIVAREVYGQRDGQKRKKRTELVVGIDGETTSIYDVPASRLITSYPIPPQESFTCPPYSIRVRNSNSADILRYTFIATKDGASQKMTLFKDVTHPDGKTTSTSASQTLKTSSIRYITGFPTTSPTSVAGEIVAVAQNGEFVCLSGETLAVQWSALSRSAVEDVVAGSVNDFQVEHVSSGTLSDFREGMFKSRLEVFSALPRALDSDPSLLALITTSHSQGQMSRHFVVLAAMSGTSTPATGLQKLIPLEVCPIRAVSTASAEAPSYQVDIQSGQLLELAAGFINVYDLTGAVPKQRCTVQVDDADSFIRLSKPFLLSTSSRSLGLYNYQYQSVHAKSALDFSELPPEIQAPRSCQLITYLRTQDLVVALVDNALVSVHVEPPKSHGKRRKAGLLIDSVGRGSSAEFRSKKRKTEGSTEFAQYVPGTMTESYLAEYHADVETANDMLGKNEVPKWEALLCKKFGMCVRKVAVLTNGTAESVQAVEDAHEGAEWEWLTDAPYPCVDRRWVTYAMGQVFSVELSASDNEPRPALRLVLPDSNVTTYLVVAGHVTLSNLRLAFREELSSELVGDKALAGDVVQCLIEADPSMTLLLNYLQATKLGEAELLLAIRRIMLSMDLIPDTKKFNSIKASTTEANDGNDKYDVDLDDLEREIAVTEHYLGDESSSRSRGLTLAFSKLWRLPAVSTVQALRATIRTEDILAFIYLLRLELVRGAWTSLYIDPSSFEVEGSDAPPDGVIALIADLLGRCLDAVGAGGWLFNDAMSWADKAEAGDFLTALKLEVTATLEGIEEAVTLNGIVGEAVRFGLASEESSARPAWNTNRPIPLQLEGRESRMLPLGLKAKQQPAKQKVVSGGEIVQRSMREMGHLISQKVEAYSLEKLAI
ncbi:hypothetical protein DCS_03621 [Drechmeria coniospora]|uniref:Utp8 beta-propeller domain-containing protein n=1 Tax=Drechmeria coniospora TaxID=98403 RepID=A0A151GHR5_DRECN|nr:hypothetical protein DCS_03621 [Drechmeria coniospora]KYK56620.1 hypothetical protein DCS_03621 [Drechmeria coniospora]